MSKKKSTPRLDITKLTDDEINDIDEAYGAVDEPYNKAIFDHQEGGDHYKDMEIQPVVFIHANNIPFIEGCVIKYMCRWRERGGVQDLKKAKHYLELLIEMEKE